MKINNNLIEYFANIYYYLLYINKENYNEQIFENFYN